MSSADLAKLSQFSKPYVIAEISSNHHQDLSEALHLVRLASQAGASAVKFQTYTADSLTLNSRNRDFLITQGPWKGTSLHELYSHSEMDWSWNREIRSLCSHLGIDFISSAFDARAVDELVSTGVDAIKIASFEITDLPLIAYAASTQLPLIISTGLASKSEIGEAMQAANEARGMLSLMHCVSSYPAKASQYSLGTISDLSNSFEVPTGLSDHTSGVGVAAASVAFGSPIFEKHFTKDTSETGSDDFFSADAAMLTSYIGAVQDAFESIREADYSLTREEQYNLKFRRSLYFVKDMNKGELVTEDTVRSIRPSYGMEPKYLPAILGRTTKRKVARGTRVSLELLEEA